MRASASSSSSSSSTKFNGAVHHAAKPKAAQRKATAQTESVDQSERIYSDMYADAASFGADYAKASPKRRLLAWTVWLLSLAGTASAAMHIVAYAMIGAVLLTGSSFIAMMIYVIGIVLSVYAALIAANQALCYVVSSKPEQHWAMVKAGGSKVLGWFKRSDDSIIPEAAQ